MNVTCVAINSKIVLPLFQDLLFPLVFRYIVGVVML